MELVAGADLATDRLQEFKQRWSVNDLYADYRQMLAQEQLDIVSVTTRLEERAEIVIATAESSMPSNQCVLVWSKLMR